MVSTPGSPRELKWWFEVQVVGAIVRHVTSSTVALVGFWLVELLVHKLLPDTSWLANVLSFMEQFGLVAMLGLLGWNLLHELWQHRPSRNTTLAVIAA